MSIELFSHSPDLNRLRSEGYFVQIIGGFLIMREVPYVNERSKVLLGTLISKLEMAGDRTQSPTDHTVFFDGDCPCSADGNEINGIGKEEHNKDLGSGLMAQYRFSSKPDGGYTDYHQKMTTYANILSGPAEALKPRVSPRVYREPEEEESSVFNYVETASDRAGIGALTQKLTGERVAIVGLGGTGSYVLDMVAKTPVQHLLIIDGDEFLQHNAFRSPGAPAFGELRKAPKKVEYLKKIYSNMHSGIVAQPEDLNESNIDLLNEVTFAFLCMDDGEAKRLIVGKLEDCGAGFVDVGMGLEFNDESLGGILRVTASTPEKRDHVHQGCIPFTGGGNDDVYTSNIQIAELNALNAALAVVKWKKIRGFYRDLEQEYQCMYTTDGNSLDNTGKLDEVQAS